MLLFTQYKTTRLTLSAVSVSLHYLPKVSDVSSHFRKTRNYCVLFTQQRSIVEQYARKFRNAILQTKQSLHDTVHNSVNLALKAV